MSADDLAARLTTGLASVDGVVDVFPVRSAAAAVLTLVTGREQAPAVAVETRDATLRISARLATSRTVRGAVVIERASDAVRSTVGAQPFVLDLEIATIE